MKPSMVTRWTFAGLATVSLFVGGSGAVILMREVETTYVRMQLETSAQQAVRIASILEQELAAGSSPDEVQRQLQESLALSTPEEAGFLCLMGRGGKVLCHPDVSQIGTIMEDMEGTSGSTPESNLLKSITRSVKGARVEYHQRYGGATHIVYEYPVRGTDWKVAVHSNFDQVQKHLRRLRKSILVIFFPTFLFFTGLGTWVVRLVERRYERHIERANSELEARVAERTADLEEASRRYQDLFEGAPSAIFVCAMDGSIVKANSQALVLTGRSLDALRQKNFASLFQRVGESAVGENALQEGLTWEGALVDSSETHRRVQVYESLLHLQSESLIQYIVQDITAQKMCETQLLHAQKMDSMGRLAGGVAHDFNNLLTAIIGYADLAQQTERSPEDRRRDLEEVRKAAERAGSLTRQLLAFSRRQIIEPKIVNLNDLILNVERMLRRLISEDIELTTLGDPALGSVRVDPGQMEQVLVNLVVNARDAMPQGGKITIETRNLAVDPKQAGSPPQTPAGGFILLVVRDTGMGMTREVKAHLFEPFFTTKGVGKGTGLGLATCYGIIKQSGGHIEVESEAGLGTQFRIYLPRMKETALPSSEQTRSKKISEGNETVLPVS